MVVRRFSLLCLLTSLAAYTEAQPTVAQTTGDPSWNFVTEAGPTFRQSAEGIELSAGPGRLTTNRVFDDVRIRFEYRSLDPRSEAILFLRSWFAFEKDTLERGYRVHLGTNESGNQALGRVTAMTNKLQQAVTKTSATVRKVGDWQQIDVRLVGEDLSASVDGVITTSARAVGDDYGHIAVQTIRGKIQFRSFEIESLSQTRESVPPAVTPPVTIGQESIRAGLVDPKVLNEVRPVYTDDAMRSRIQGNVRLEVVVLQNGTVGDVKVVKRLHPALDAKAIEAARKWRFTPATTKDGKPVAVYVTLDLSFRIF